MERVVLRYGRGSFIVITGLLIVMSAVLLFFLSSFASGRDLVLPAAALCILTIVVYGIVPMFIFHYVEDRVLVLNQGLFFKGRLLFSDIVSVERVDRGPFRTGVFFNLRGAVLYVTTRRRDLLVVKLRERRRFGMVFGKSVDTVIFDCIDTDRAIEVLRAGITPASQDRRS